MAALFGAVPIALGYGVLFHDADQHDQSDESVDVQIDVEDVQRDQRAESGRRQTRQNGQWVDVALVQNAQHDVHHHDRDNQQDPQVTQRALEGSGCSLELRAHSRRQFPGGNLLNARHHLTQ